MPRSNKDKDKDPLIDEVLAETPPDINEPQDNSDGESGIPKEDILPDPENEEPKDEPAKDETEDKPDEEEPVEEKKEEPPQETPEQKEQRYKAQQSEAQIQVEKNKALTDKVEEAARLADPTEAELRAYVQKDSINWDELTNFEQAMAKRTLINEKRFAIVNDSVQESKKVDEWAKKLDTFIDSTDGKPEFIDLSSHEADFRKFAMKEAHRGTPVDILLGAFLHNLPVKEKKGGSIFLKGGGGEKVEHKEGIVDAEQVAALRLNDPREFKRQVKAGKIKISI